MSTRTPTVAEQTAGPPVRSTPSASTTVGTAAPASGAAPATENRSWGIAPGSAIRGTVTRSRRRQVRHARQDRLVRLRPDAGGAGRRRPAVRQVALGPVVVAGAVALLDAGDVRGLVVRDVGLADADRHGASF